MPSAGACAAASFFHTAGQVRPCCLERRRQTEYDAGKYRDRKSEEQYPSIDGYIRFAGQRKRWYQQFQTLLQSEPQTQPEDAAADRQKHVLRQELAHQPPS